MTASHACNSASSAGFASRAWSTSLRQLNSRLRSGWHAQTCSATWRHGSAHADRVRLSMKIVRNTRSPSSVAGAALLQGRGHSQQDHNEPVCVTCRLNHLVERAQGLTSIVLPIWNGSEHHQREQTYCDISQGISLALCSFKKAKSSGVGYRLCSGSLCPVRIALTWYRSSTS